MEALFSVLLVENRIPEAVAVGQTIARHLPSYRLSISRRLDEGIDWPEAVDAILLGAPQLAGSEEDSLSSLLAAYPDTPVTLLVEVEAVAGTAGETLHRALSAGVADYAVLSEAGLLLLGRRLRQFQARWQGSRQPAAEAGESGRYARALAQLAENSQALAETWGTPAGLENLLGRLVRALDVSGSFLVSWRLDQPQATLLAKFPADRDPTGSDLAAMLKPGDRPALLAGLAQGQPVLIHAGQPGLAETEAAAMQQCGALSQFLLPLVVKGETIGWLELYDTRRLLSLAGHEREMALILAHQAAVALDNLQQHRQARQALLETEALYQVASALVNTQDAQTIMSTVLQEYLGALGLKQGSIVIFDFNQKCGVVKVHFRNDPAAWPVEPAGPGDQANPAPGAFEGRQIPLIKDAIYERLMRTYQPVVVDGRSTNPLTPAAGHVPRQSMGEGWSDPDALSLLVIPVQIRGEIMGAIVAEATRQPRAFEPWDIALGQAMADQLGLALFNVQLYEAEYQRRRQAETLREVSFVVGSSLHLNEVLEHILDQLGRVVNYDSAAIHLIEGKQRRIIAGRGFPNPEQVIGMTFPIQPDKDEPGSLAIYTRHPLVIGNVAEAYPVFQQTPHHHIKSWMGLPLIARGRVIGLISIDQAKPDAFTQEDMELAQAFANQVAVALENARLYELEVRELEHELEIAQGIQEALLPQFLPQVPGLQICGRLLPARQIGGDFFHFFATDDEQLGVVIGDVSGKGIPAALYMAVAITAIEINIKNRLTPAELLNQLNQNLYNRLKSNKMNIGLQVATFAPLALHSGPRQSAEPETRGAVVTIASAGMVAPMGATVHGCRFLPVSGMPLGALPPAEYLYPEDVFLLDPFTTVIFTSDGIVEAQNEAGELFGFDRLEAVVNEIVHTRDAETIAEHIIQTAQVFIGDVEQHDDMTVVVVVKT